MTKTSYTVFAVFAALVSVECFVPQKLAVARAGEFLDGD